MLKTIFVYVIFLVVLTGCQCVTSIDTPKDVTPTFFAHVLFINGHPDLDEINILTDNTTLVKSLYYNTNPKNYNEISPGSRNVQITSPLDSVLFNSSLELDDKKNYTFLVYGTTNRVQTLFFNDTIPNYSQNNTYFRFVDISPDSPQFIVKVADQYPIINTIQYRKDIKYYPATAGKYDIELKVAETDSLALSMKSVEMKSGKIYTILIKGYYDGIGAQKLQFHVIENTLVR